MKKKLILPLMLLFAVMLLGIEKNFSFFTPDSDNNKKTISTNPVLLESPASVIWPLISNITSNSLEGNLESNLSYSSSTAHNIQSKIDFTGDGVLDGNVVFWEGTLSGNSWTGTGNASTINESVYVQIEVNPTNGGTFTINRIESLVGASGTGNMYYKAFYSINSDFSNRVLVKDATKLTQNASMTMDVTIPSIEISGSQKFYLRFYPYIVSSTANKQFGLRNVKISGTMEGSVANLATVSTTAVSAISTTSAISGGTISSNGGGEITASGVVWSINENPTIITDNHTNGAATTGSYSSSLIGLNPNTTYFLRAYATNSAGTAYGNQISFITLSSLTAPTVVTVSQSNVTNKSFIVSGNVTHWGGTDVTERGIVYSKTNPSPSLENATKVISGSGNGTFSSFVGNLESSTVYYARTYAINNIGNAYGSSATITTKTTDPDVMKTINPDGTADYTTVQEAFNAVPTNYTGRWIIFIKPGTYNERPSLAQNKNNVYLIGENAVTTIITNNISAGDINPETNLAYGTANSQTMAIFGNDFVASKITVANTFMNSNIAASQNSATQAVALKTQGDRQAFYDCRIMGYQDTYLGNSIGRAYFKNCYIEGNVDFIFGRQTVIFDHCTTYINRNNSVIVAPSTESSTKFGMVFLDCNLTVPEAGTTDFNGGVINNFHFGRPWQNRPKAAFIRCDVPNMLNPIGWTTMNAGLNPIFVEYGNSGAGATPERLAQRGNEGVVLTQEESQVYNVSNIFKKDTDPSFLFDWVPEESINITPPILGANDNTNNTIKTNVYPNPFTSSINMTYHLTATSDISIAIYDVNGRTVKHFVHKGKSGLNDININTEKLSNGIYFYNIKTNNGQTNGKLIRKL